MDNIETTLETIVAACRLLSKQCHATGDEVAAHVDFATFHPDCLVEISENMLENLRTVTARAKRLDEMHTALQAAFGELSSHNMGGGNVCERIDLRGDLFLLISDSEDCVPASESTDVVAVGIYRQEKEDETPIDQFFFNLEEQDNAPNLVADIAREIASAAKGEA